jgi:cytochrome c oxidase accessory protein FixG
MTEEHRDTESYRDSISTVDSEGKRIWVYPKKPSGKFYKRRTYVSYVLLLFLFGIPIIHVNGDPILLFNIIERKFIIFGIVFWPHDFHLFALSMIAGVVMIALFTVVYGRLFCGWVCPQTIFMELVFRKIEYWIEGDRNRQKALKRRAWDRDKIQKKLAKHSIYLFISFLISNTFLAYIIGYKELIKIVTDSPMEHLGGLSAMVVFSLLFYGVFSQLREQVCTTICPYGRLQGALLDRDSMVIAYDKTRGENRSPFRKGVDRKAEGKGDCIDCNQCVDVCPTGIDIRNGTQLECTNCTACIDACDAIMDKINLPRGLVRYATENEIESGAKKKFTTKSVAYTVVLALIFIVITGLMVTRSEIEATVLRAQGSVYYEIDDNRYSNIFTIKLVNKTHESYDLDIRLMEGPGAIQIIGEELIIDEQSELEGTFMIIVDQKDIKQFKTNIIIGIFSGDRMLDKVKTTFLGPNG